MYVHRLFLGWSGCGWGLNGAGLVNRFGEFSAVTGELARWRKFSELVSNHVFYNDNVDEVLSIVDKEYHTDHFWRDRGGACPGFNWGLAAWPGFLHLGHEFYIKVWTFFETTGHR